MSTPEPANVMSVEELRSELAKAHARNEELEYKLQSAQTLTGGPVEIARGLESWPGRDVVAEGGGAMLSSAHSGSMLSSKGGTKSTESREAHDAFEFEGDDDEEKRERPGALLFPGSRGPSPNGAGDNNAFDDGPEPPIPCVIISDPGEDLDDEMAMVMLRYLMGRGYLDCKGVVANLKPASTRALLLRGTLDVLGLWNVPVGVGTDGGSNTHKETFVDTAKDYMPTPGSERAQCILPGRALLHRALCDAEPNSLAIICISSLKDAALFLRDNQSLFAEKVRGETRRNETHTTNEAERGRERQRETQREAARGREEERDAGRG